MSSSSECARTACPAALKAATSPYDWNATSPATLRRATARAMIAAATHIRCAIVIEPICPDPDASGAWSYTLQPSARREVREPRRRVSPARLEAATLKLRRARKTLPLRYFAPLRRWPRGAFFRPGSPSLGGVRLAQGHRLQREAARRGKELLGWVRSSNKTPCGRPLVYSLRSACPRPGIRAANGARA